ncbi:hypothetical protein KYI92_15065 [Pantoea allii]|uniref:Uncharacterized protein n=1 Tax=Pantoea allii TaxID=574096 RepID=A0ABS6VH66_9GAMM|nr:hypothetical protein [Pantoea allii]MBW1215032.1 hypothetical protein [Pantoea allii]MBW1258601.1 hypothetical protein [Pantoea allii]MBW1267822.1 hypothetical protein [Pantoea allii]MBW1289693.1 hypothetical protein [Pantoea allii]
MIIPFDLRRAVANNLPLEGKRNQDAIFFALICSIQNKLKPDSAMKNQGRLVLISSSDGQNKRITP